MNIEYTIKSVFQYAAEYYDPVKNVEYSCLQRNMVYSKFMEIPVDKPLVDVPLFVLSFFVAQMAKKLNLPDYSVDTLVIPLHPASANSRFKSMSPFFNSCWNGKNICRISIPEKDILYYIGKGVVFNKDFKPVCICSLQFQKEYHPETGAFLCYSVVRPVLRVQPYIMFGKNDIMENFIKNKVLKTFLENVVYMPYGLSPIVPNVNTSERHNVQVILEDAPWHIKEVDSPSISTTNEELCDLALEHISEIFYDC